MGVQGITAESEKKPNKQRTFWWNNESVLFIF